MHHITICPSSSCSPYAAVDGENHCSCLLLTNIEESLVPKETFICFVVSRVQISVNGLRAEPLWDAIRVDEADVMHRRAYSPVRTQECRCNGRHLDLDFLPRGIKNPEVRLISLVKLQGLSGRCVYLSLCVHSGVWACLYMNLLN